MEGEFVTLVRREGRGVWYSSGEAGRYVGVVWYFSKRQGGKGCVVL